MRFLASLFIVLAGVAQAEVPARTFHGRVVEVSDGDTVALVTDSGQRLRVRLAAIDAPETSCHDSAPPTCVETAQPYGTAARAELARLVLDRDVTVRVVDVDAYQRAVGFVHRNGVDVNYELVARGAACHFVRYAQRLQTASEFAQYRQAEQQARAQRRGQWRQPDAQCGWEYRAARRAR